MAINVSEITSVLKREIANFEDRLKVTEVGTVIEVGDGIARIYGLKGAMAGELLEFENVRAQIALRAPRQDGRDRCHRRQGERCLTRR